MPRKNCCCNIVPPIPGSCCRPIYNGCVGKTYEFSFRFSAKYPCMKSNGSPAIYECQNNSSITYDIPGNFETYEIVCQYTIDNPAEINTGPSCFTRSVTVSSATCNDGNFGCQGPDFDPNNPTTWKFCDDPISLCPRCACRTNEQYSYCNFDEDKLRTSCGCDTGLIPWIWSCGASSTATTSWIYNLPDPCGTDGFGNPRPFTVVQEGNDKLINVWNGCYTNYRLKGRDTLFTDSLCGCTFEPGNRNLLDSYTVQFIPDPSIPEQSSSTYQPKIIIDLINFNFECNSSQNVQFPGYNINFSLGIGYRQDFKCGGTTNNPVTETFYIPFQICEDSFFGGIYYDGLYVEGNYTRDSFTTDPFDLCIPPSTTTHIKNNSGGRCTQEILYKDSYTGDSYGLIGNNGSPANDFSTIVPTPLMADVCFSTFDGSEPDSKYCNYLRFTNKILVSEV